MINIMVVLTGTLVKSRFPIHTISIPAPQALRMVLPLWVLPSPLLASTGKFVKPVLISAGGINDKMLQKLVPHSTRMG